MVFKLVSVYSVISYVTAMLAMAFFTLLERKILGYSQLRKGPNKVSFIGFLQPFADAMKLFVKEAVILNKSNLIIFIIAPMGSLFFNLVLWSLFPFPSQPSFLVYSVVMFTCISGMSVYSVIVAGWASNSKYALLGSMRSLAQMISYEVSMIFIIISLCVLVNSLSFMDFSKTKSFLMMIMLPLFIPWIISILAETNRAPFDLPEGEAELVSGFNVEYGAGLFAFIFMAEYSNVLIFSVITAVFFFSLSSMILASMVIAFIVLWVRATLPIIRYDQLMNMAWKCFLPVSIAFLLYATMFMCLVNFKLQT